MAKILKPLPKMNLKVNSEGLRMGTRKSDPRYPSLKRYGDKGYDQRTTSTGIIKPYKKTKVPLKDYY
jgi:hypothetical protein